MILSEYILVTNYLKNLSSKFDVVVQTKKVSLQNFQDIQILNSKKKLFNLDKN